MTKGTKGQRKQYSSGAGTVLPFQRLKEEKDKENNTLVEHELYYPSRD